MKKLIYFGIISLVFCSLFSSCGNKEKKDGNSEEISEAVMFDSQDTAEVYQLCQLYLNAARNQKFDSCASMLHYFDEYNNPKPISQEDIDGIHKEFQHFPVLNYQLESSEFDDPNTVKVVYSVRFMDKPANEPNFPDSYRVSFSPRRVAGQWYLSLSKTDSI